MPQTNWGPVNITQGDSASFTVEFYDTGGNISNPSGPTLNITYTNTSNSIQTDNISLSSVNSFYTGTWSSTSATYGLATWIAATSSNAVAQTGQIRVIY